VGVTDCLKGLYALRFTNTNKRDGRSRLRLALLLRRTVIRQVRDGAVDSDFLVWELAWQLESVKCSCRECRRLVQVILPLSASTTLFRSRAEDLGQHCSIPPGEHEAGATRTTRKRDCAVPNPTPAARQSSAACTTCSRGDRLAVGRDAGSVATGSQSSLALDLLRVGKAVTKLAELRPTYKLTYHAVGSGRTSQMRGEPTLFHPTIAIRTARFVGVWLIPVKRL